MAACVVRRIAAVSAPCGRRELIAKAKRALNGALPEPSSSVLHEILDDLIACGDLTEQVGLRLGTEEAPVLVFLAPPGFTRTVQRVYLHGVAPDDAPCIPKSVSESLVYAGSRRFLECDDVRASAELLVKFGLVDHTDVRWPTSVREPDRREILDIYRASLEHGAELKALRSATWLAPADGSTYRHRWKDERESKGLQIARIPQFYGADVWLLVDHAAFQRAVQLPIRGLPSERGCDAAWRLQLALDSFAGMPARFHARIEDDIAHLRVDFPLPQRERRKLLNLGGIRSGTARPYDFDLPSDALPAAIAVLQQLGFEPISTEPSE